MEVTREIDESSWGEVIGDKMHDYCYGQNDKRRDVWMIGREMEKEFRRRCIYGYSY